jgi:hypothetical protein
VKLCKDCRFAAHEIVPPPDNDRAEFEGRLARDPSYVPPRVWLCKHPSSYVAAVPDYVTGEPSEPPHRLQCRSARVAVLNCGPEGRYWEALTDDGELEAPFEWTSLSPCSTGLPISICLPDLPDDLLVIADSAFVSRVHLRMLADWVALNRDAINAHRRGEIDSVELVRRLQRL